MAQVLSLVRKNDFVADVDSLSLLSFTSGISVEREGFIPTVEGGTEIIKMMVKGTTRDGLATYLQGLEAKLRQIMDFMSSTAEPYYVVLRDQAPNETSARETLVTGASVRLGSTLHQENLFVREYTLSLDRAGLWEATAAETKTFSTLAFYGMAASSNTLGGVAPGRVGRMTIKGISGKGTIEELWLGFRTARFCTLASYISTWEVERGTLHDTPASMTPALGTDATATPGSGNTCVTITFAADDVECEVITLTGQEIATVGGIPTSDYVHLRGTFDLILRAKVGASTACTVRVNNGVLDGSLAFVELQRGDQVAVASTTWKYYNVGRISWPPLGRVTSNLDALVNACLQIQVQRTSGTGTLTIDHIIPVPVDEGYAHLDGMSVVYATNDTNARAEMYCDPLGNVAGVQYGAGIVVGNVDTGGSALDTFTMPAAAARLIVAAQTASPALTDQLTVVLEAFKRYPTLRGSA